MKGVWREGPLGILMTSIGDGADLWLPSLLPPPMERPMTILLELTVTTIVFETTCQEATKRERERERESALNGTRLIAPARNSHTQQRKENCKICQENRTQNSGSLRLLMSEDMQRSASNVLRVSLRICHSASHRAR